MTRFARRYRRIGRSLSRVELMRSSMDETFALSQEDLLDRNRGRRFLDYYGDQGLRIALERYGFLDALRARGFEEFTIEAWAHDERHTLLIDARRDGMEGRLLELVVRRDRLLIAPLEGFDLDITKGFDVLTVDWLSLRDPTRPFTETRLRLPGQDAPGLGVGERVLELLYRIVDRLGLAGLVTVAEYLHNAILYARELPFVDPFYEGQLRALEGLLFAREKLSFAQAAWAMHWGYVVDLDDSVVRHRGEAMVHPSDEVLREYVRSDAYVRHVAKAEASLRYRLRRTAFDERWASMQDSLLQPPDDPLDAT